MPSMPPSRNNRAKLIPGDGPLARVPPFVVFLVVLAVFGVAIWLGGWRGAALLGALALGMVYLLTVTWPLLRNSDRFIRLTVVAVIAAVALSVYHR
jgi:hypothetical protein